MKHLSENSNKRVKEKEGNQVNLSEAIGDAILEVDNLAEESF